MPDARPGPTSERSKRCEDCGRPIPSYRKKLCPEHALARLEERKRTWARHAYHRPANKARAAAYYRANRERLIQYARDRRARLKEVA